jgi:uncharacterized protein (TIGR00106 family)
MLREAEVIKAIADVCVVPIGVGVSVSKYVVVCEEIFRDAGLAPRLHAYGTNVEGDWDDVMKAVRQCHERIHEMGAPRVSTSIRIGTRTDRDQSMQDKIDSVTSKLDD